MLRKACLLLLALPTLLPQGFCLCRLDGVPSRNAVPEAAPCCCDNPQCRSRPAPPSPQSARLTEAEQPPLTPEHAPGCPAHDENAVRRALSAEVTTHPSDLFAAPAPAWAVSPGPELRHDPPAPLPPARAFPTPHVLRC